MDVSEHDHPIMDLFSDKSNWNTGSQISEKMLANDWPITPGYLTGISSK